MGDKNTGKGNPEEGISNPNNADDNSTAELSKKVEDLTSQIDQLTTNSDALKGNVSERDKKIAEVQDQLLAIKKVFTPDDDSPKVNLDELVKKVEMLASRHDVLETKNKERLEAFVNGLPEEKRGYVPSQLSVEDQLAWIDRNKGLFEEKKSSTIPPTNPAESLEGAFVLKNWAELNQMSQPDVETYEKERKKAVAEKRKIITKPD